jgi:dephospho-CoA kinase
LVVAGLTGGIATGKSTVSSLLASYGAIVIDADRIAREAVRKGTPAWEGIREHFGKDMIARDGEIDRELLGSVIFGNQDKIDLLNSIVHPAVIRDIDLSIGSLKARGYSGIVICDVPLLIETGMNALYPEILLVYVPEPLQIERLMARDSISRETALKKVRSQMPIEEKKAYATLVIDNSRSLEETSGHALAAYSYLLNKGS